jgi:membrane associated rhomboid family serine protease
MIPIRDTLTLTRVPWVTRTLVVLNLAVFTVQLFAGRTAEVMIQVFGFIPARLLDPARFGYSWLESGLTLATSLFLHGGYVHLVGNLIYLWIFGDDVEERLGHGRYALFYLACGAAGSLTHAWLFPSSPIPSIGASGSIAGLLGAFLLLHPKAKIVTLVPLIVSWLMVEIPALVFLPIWFGVQFLNGWLALASAEGVQEVAGVAWWAHVGGFSMGVVVAMTRLGRSPRSARTWASSG